jgi:hypothetical protein
MPVESTINGLKKMPYIKSNIRDDLNPCLTNVKDAMTAGELNYQITELIRNYWIGFPNYQGINDIVGALECAKQEFIRRVVNPYEDKKIIENGDIYD